MTVLTSLDRSFDLGESWRLRQVRILEITGRADRDEPGARLGGAVSWRDELIGPMVALVPKGTSIELDTVHGSGAAMEQLREKAYEVLLVHHAPPGLDALELLRALRSADGTEAVVVICAAAEPSLVRECFALGADTLALPCGAFDAAAQFVWRAAQRAEMARQLQRLDAQRRRRVQRESGESTVHQHALEQIVVGLAQAQGAGGQDRTFGDSRQGATHEPLQAQYHQLLRLYVVMGAGNLSDEVAHWSSLLAGAGVSVAEFFRLHLECVAQLKQALGNRGSRHCDRRADLLLIELLAHLARHHERSAGRHDGIPPSFNSPTLPR
jgi:DNA-binding NarL/FixJ family response regulator